VSVQSFEKALADKNTILLDVRSPQEFEEGHLHNAINLDVLSSDFTSKVDALNTQNTVMVYCRSVKRSATAASILQSKGFKVIDLAGGITAWTSAGKSIVQ
jgi:rhodanese-related sulfurtransferase